MLRKKRFGQNWGSKSVRSMTVRTVFEVFSHRKKAWIHMLRLYTRGYPHEHRERENTYTHDMMSSQFKQIPCQFQWLSNGRVGSPRAITESSTHIRTIGPSEHTPHCLEYTWDGVGAFSSKFKEIILFTIACVIPALYNVLSREECDFGF